MVNSSKTRRGRDVLQTHHRLVPHEPPPRLIVVQFGREVEADPPVGQRKRLHGENRLRLGVGLPAEFAPVAKQHGQLLVDARGNDFVAIAHAHLQPPLDRMLAGFHVGGMGFVDLVAAGRLFVQLQEFREGLGDFFPDHPYAEAVPRQSLPQFRGEVLLVDLLPHLPVDGRVVERTTDEDDVHGDAARRHLRRPQGRFSRRRLHGFTARKQHRREKEQSESGVGRHNDLRTRVK